MLKVLALSKKKKKSSGFKFTQGRILFPVPATYWVILGKGLISQRLNSLKCKREVIIIMTIAPSEVS